MSSTTTFTIPVKSELAPVRSSHPLSMSGIALTGRSLVRNPHGSGSTITRPMWAIRRCAPRIGLENTGHRRCRSSTMQPALQRAYLMSHPLPRRASAVKELRSFLTMSVPTTFSKEWAERHTRRHSIVKLGLNPTTPSPRSAMTSS